MSAAARLIAFALLFTLTACATGLGTDFQKPRFDLVDLRVKDLGLLQQQYVVVLNVQNPNSRAIPVQGLSYELALAGQEFARGVSSKSFTLPAHGETTVELNLSTNLLTSFSKLRGILENPPADLGYTFTGRLDTGLPFVGAVPFTNEGSINLRL